MSQIRFSRDLKFGRIPHPCADPAVVPIPELEAEQSFQVLRRSEVRQDSTSVRTSIGKPFGKVPLTESRNVFADGFIGSERGSPSRDPRRELIGKAPVSKLRAANVPDSLFARPQVRQDSNRGLLFGRIPIEVFVSPSPVKHFVEVL